MKKAVIIAVFLLFCIAIPAQAAENESAAESQRDYTWLIGFDGGLGMPMEFYDLEAVGMDGHLSFDFAYPVRDNLAVGFYFTFAVGFLSRVHPYSPYDQFFTPFKINAGLMMEIGDLKNKPFLLGFAPCAGLGFVDMDLVIPVEIRFGRFFYGNWYLMGSVTYGISLAKETAYFEPAIIVGYNFGHKKRK